MLIHEGDVRYVILICHSYVTVYIYPRYSHLKSLASYFGLQVSRTHPHVYYSFLLRLQLLKKVFESIPVCRTRIGIKASKIRNRVGNVRACHHGKVLE